jgi:hypothetical protein
MYSDSGRGGSEQHSVRFKPNASSAPAPAHGGSEELHETAPPGNEGRIDGIGGIAVGKAVGSGGISEGIDDGSGGIEGNSVGSGGIEGIAVGRPVGSPVGSAVGSAVGRPVGSAVGSDIALGRPRVKG